MRHIDSWLKGAVILCTLAWLITGATHSQDRPALYRLPNANTPIFKNTSMALTQQGRIVLTNMLSDSLSILDPNRRTLIAEIPLGRAPRQLALSPSHDRVFVINHRDESLSVVDLEQQTVSATYPIGGSPYGIVSPDDNTAYIALQGRDEIVRVDLRTGIIDLRIPTPPAPSGLALWGDLLYITHARHGQLSLLYLPTQEVVRSIPLSTNANLALSLEIDPHAGRAYIPHSLSQHDLVGAELDQRAIAMLSVVDLVTLQVTERWLLNVWTGYNVTMPFSARLNANRTRLYIAQGGSNRVTVVDLRQRIAIAHMLTEANPRELLLSRDNLTLYVHEAVDQSLSLYDTTYHSLMDRVPSSDLVPPALLGLGATLFYDATDQRLSATGTLSCANCHWEGGSDGRTWFGRTTPIFQAETLQLEGLNGHIGEMMGGTGLEETQLDYAALVAYLRHLAR